MKRLILIAHSEAQVVETCNRVLGREGYRVESVPDCSQLAKLVATREPAALLTAIRMPGKDGLEILKEALGADPTLPVIAITAHASVSSAVKFIRAGGTNYLASPFKADQLVHAVNEALAGPTPPIGTRADAGDPSRVLDSILGTSRQMLDLKKTLAKVARTDANVLIRGETGTGKELAARAVHDLSPRRSHAFLPVDCAALPPTLLESELFGHEKGAFTGADRSRYGLFEAANRGTVFLDEIGELDVSTQSKLFRVLQEGRIRQIGGRKDTLIDVRVVAATNRDLEEELQTGKFREELYYRLNVVALALPPLRERTADLPLLANCFFQLFKSSHGRDDLTELDSSFVDGLLEYRWPGNIRELRNVVERAVVLSEGPAVTRKDLGELLIGQRDEANAFEFELEENLHDYSLAREKLLEAFDRQYFERLLSVCQGNVSEVARQSGIGRKTLYNKLNRIGIIPFDSSDRERLR